MQSQSGRDSVSPAWAASQPPLPMGLPTAEITLNPPLRSAILLWRAVQPHRSATGTPGAIHPNPGARCTPFNFMVSRARGKIRGPSEALARVPVVPGAVTIRPAFRPGERRVRSCGEGSTEPTPGSGGGAFGTVTGLDAFPATAGDLPIDEFEWISGPFRSMNPGIPLRSCLRQRADVRFEESRCSFFLVWRAAGPRMPDGHCVRRANGKTSALDTMMNQIATPRTPHVPGSLKSRASTWHSFMPIRRSKAGRPPRPACRDTSASPRRPCTQDFPMLRPILQTPMNEGRIGVFRPGFAFAEPSTGRCGRCFRPLCDSFRRFGGGSSAPGDRPDPLPPLRAGSGPRWLRCGSAAAVAGFRRGSPPRGGWRKPPRARCC